MSDFEFIVQEDKDGVAIKIVFTCENISISFTKNPKYPLNPKNEMRISEGRRKIVNTGLGAKKNTRLPAGIFSQIIKLAHGILLEGYDREVEEIKAKHKKLLSNQFSNKQEIAWANNLSKRGVYFNALGDIIFVKCSERGRKAKYKIVPLNDLFSAIRRQRHILETYIGDGVKILGEVDVILGIQNLISDFNLFLVNSKNKDPNIDKAIREKSDFIISTLEKCLDEFKVNAREGIEKIDSSIDSRGRKNIPSKAVISVKAKNDLSKRIKKISRIISSVTTKRNLLIDFQAHNNQRLLEVKGILIDINQSDFLNHQREINNNIGKIIHILSWRLVNPYKSLSDEIMPEIFLAKECFAAKDYEGFSNALNSIYLNLTQFLRKKQEI